LSTFSNDRTILLNTIAYCSFSQNLDTYGVQKYKETNPRTKEH